MDKKRRARKIVLIIFVVIFVLAVVAYVAELVMMYNDRVYVHYQGESYQAHRRLGSGYTLPEDAGITGRGGDG